MFDQDNKLYLIILSYIHYLFAESGCEINFFFSDSHLAPKFFKVVANSKKVGHHFQRQTKSFFTLSTF